MQDDASDGPAGSEYMASSIVKGCPDECLSVLVDLSSNTTILGPASRIELLEDGEERQVREPAGWQACTASPRKVAAASAALFCTTVQSQCKL